MKTAILFLPLASLLLCAAARADDEWVAKCAKGEANACALAGRNAAQAGDVAGAQRLFDTGCTQGDASACMELGGIYVKQSQPDKAIPIYESVCNGEGPVTTWGCRSLVKLYTEGGVAHDEAHLTALKARLQQKEQAALAKMRADAAAEDAADDARVKGDPQGFADKERKCRGGDMPSCQDAALPYLGSDPDRAVGLLERSCADKLATSCGFSVPALKMGRRAGPERATRALRASCDRGYVDACRTLGIVLNSAGLWGYPEDLDAAQAAFEKAAALGDEPALSGLAAILERRGRMDEAAAVKARIAGLKAQRERAEADRQAAAARLEQALAPFAARMDELEREEKFLKGTRIDFDRLPANERKEADPTTSADDLAAEEETDERREGRRQEIEQLFTSLAAAAPGAKP